MRRMKPKLIGGNPLERDEKGNPKYNMGLVFPDHNTVVIGKGSHCLVREQYVSYLNEERKKKGLDEFSLNAEIELTKKYVDIVIRGENVYIRPGKKPSAGYMETVFFADEILQELVPEQKIKFLGVDDPDIRKYIKQRGELWRISSLPRTIDGMKKLIENSMVSIRQREMYYHNAVTGTRFLTCHEFSRLGELDKEGLAACLNEIKEYSEKKESC